MDTAPNRPTSPSASTYDLLKFVMIVVMVIDHIGFFFCPDDLTWRAVGRAGAPAWFFLLGYGRSTKGGFFSPVLWGGAVALMLGEFFILERIAFNALFTMGLIKLTQPLWSKMVRTTTLPLILIIAVGLDPYAREIIEYGTMAWAFAIWGWLQREAQNAEARGVPVSSGGRLVTHVYALAALVCFFAIQTVRFEIAGADLAIMIVCSAAMAVWLGRFRPQALDITGAPAALLRFCGRQTLLIYVVHFLMFAAIARFL